MKNMNLYNFLGKMALEFRLSLDNICKIMGKEPTEKIKMEIYKSIEQTVNNNQTLSKSYKYLFFYETFNESKKAYIIAQTKAINFVRRYKKALLEGNKDKLNELQKELYKTDNQFKEISNKISIDKLSDEDIEKIVRYRIKYAIPRNVFCKSYGIGRSSFTERERKVSSDHLKQKLELLSEYHYTLNKINRNSEYKK